MFPVQTATNVFMNTQGQGVHKLACSKKKSDQLQSKQAQAKVPDVIAPTRSTRSTVNYLVSMMVEQHEIGSTSNDEPKSKSKARGADFRKAHTAVFKAKVIHCEPGVLTSQTSMVEISLKSRSG